MRLYIGNINYQTTIPILESWLTPYGMVKDIYLPLSKDTVNHVNQGFAFVTMGSEYAGQKVIDSLHHQPDPIWGRKLVVQVAKERPAKTMTNTNS